MFRPGIRLRLLISHLFATVLLAGAFGTFVYTMAARQVMHGLQAQVTTDARLISRLLDVTQVSAAAVDEHSRAALNSRLHAIAQDSSRIARIDVVEGAGGDARVVASSDLAADNARAGDDGAGPETLIPLPGQNRYALAVSATRADVDEQLFVLRMSALVAFLVCVLAAMVLSRNLSNHVIARTSDLAARCRALANGESLPPRRSGTHDELDVLAREFDAMAGRLRHAAQGREEALKALHEANAGLESRVQARTRELEGANVQLRSEIENRVHVEALLAEAALTDPLTGLLNRRAMMEMLGQAVAQLKPGEPGLSIIVADIDHFKRVNDAHGHDVGDQVLVATGTTLRDLVGEALQHNVARWGGEEFLILLPGVRLAAACKSAEQFRSRIAALRVGDAGLRVTLSLGVSELNAGDSLDDCLRRSDQALYRAKEAGRNAVVAAQGALFATMS